MSTPENFVPSIQVEPNQYYAQKYDSKERFISYWYQIRAIRRLDVSSLLEVGVGNRFLTDYLRKRGMQLCTLDIEPRLLPDCVGSASRLPFCDNSFEAIACFEVLEHLPYELLGTILGEFRRVARRDVVLSLPDYERAYQFHVQLPKVGDIRSLIPAPRLRKPVHRFDGEHWWEIGRQPYLLDRVIARMNEAGFDVLETYRLPEHQYHRFFVLKISR
jgi:hypothetical protein